MKSLHQSKEDSKKEQLITALLQEGIFKRGNEQLFELSLSELEEEYQKVIK
ncbi:MAG TPA: Fur-regulated basic protein FbpA [Pseudoneobacillus sp.]|nr:Fur-regulated basic protein FbpA [Pseudoneobacillus sp.]